MESFEVEKYTRFGNLFADYKKGWSYEHDGDKYKVPSSYVFKVALGFSKPYYPKGAGYKGGITFFFARNSGSRRWQKTFRGSTDRRAPFGFEIGWTRNANKVPYVSH